MSKASQLRQKAQAYLQKGKVDKEDESEGEDKGKK